MNEFVFIEFTGTAEITDKYGDDITDENILEDFDGFEYDGFDFVFAMPSHLREIVVSEQTAFTYEDGQFYVTTKYMVGSSNVTQTVLAELKDYTVGQWSDGIGEIFEQQEQVVDDQEIYLSMWHMNQIVNVRVVEL